LLNYQSLLRACSEWQLPALPDRQAMPTTLSSNQLFTILLSQHLFHVVQAINGGAHLRLINNARSFRIHDLTSKIHLHLTRFLSDHSLNDGRGLF